MSRGSLAAPPVFAAIFALHLACQRPPEVDPEPVAREIWDGRCANCHGPEGRGDGPTGAALVAAPRSFHDPAWQAATTDAQIRLAILYGGAAAGYSDAMPPNPDLRERPRVVEALIKKIRGYRPAPTPTR